MNKNLGIAVGVGVLIIMGAFFLREKSTETSIVVPTTITSNVTMEGEKQVVMIDAKGGYLPEVSTAKAGVPTIVRFNTTGTFDCSASVRIPSRDVSQILPQSGTTDIDIGVNEKGPLEGSCGMGMYPFQIEFIE
ncbi:cupredoxin domain-containing protein [Candidatus Kaiserbacteria bacterium]|nr:MAG: cupredoxin domain-containing protein [Candidatus Kaiserbacteria bacterium]